MTKTDNCTFCKTELLDWRTILADDLIRSVVSRPWFREGHCLVVPNRHIEEVSQLRDEESSAIMAELGRLSLKLDNGFGAGMMQKFQPTQGENGIKVNHLHFHIFPRLEEESGLFPVPEPNDFQDGFSFAPDKTIGDLANKLRVNKFEHP